MSGLKLIQNSLLFDLKKIIRIIKCGFSILKCRNKDIFSLTRERVEKVRFFPSRDTEDGMSLEGAGTSCPPPLPSPPSVTSPLSTQTTCKYASSKDTICYFYVTFPPLRRCVVEGSKLYIPSSYIAHLKHSIHDSVHGDRG